MTSPTDPSSGLQGDSGVQGKVSGPLVVIVLFSCAFLMFGILFFVSYRQKLSDQAALAAQNASEFSDSATTAETVRMWMASLPREWVKVTAVEGQGYVFLVPCYSSNATLTFKSEPDSSPRLVCEYCDSLGEYAVRSIARNRRDSSWEYRLGGQEGEAGRMRIMPVTDTLLKNFPEAPFKDKILLWTRSRKDGTGGPAKIDTLLFVPKTQANEFEILRAEDENPEGCGTESAD
jgi:hypothetical protein